MLDLNMQYVVRTAIFVARQHESKLEQFDTINIRFNMDGTLIGNKHIVGISINCIEKSRSVRSLRSTEREYGVVT